MIIPVTKLSLKSLAIGIGKIENLVHSKWTNLNYVINLRISNPHELELYQSPLIVPTQILLPPKSTSWILIPDNEHDSMSSYQSLNYCYLDERVDRIII